MSPSLDSDVSTLHSLRLVFSLCSHQHCYGLVWYVWNIFSSVQTFGDFVCKKLRYGLDLEKKQGFKTKKPNVPHKKETSIMINITEFNTNYYQRTIICQEIEEIPGFNGVLHD